MATPLARHRLGLCSPLLQGLHLYNTASTALIWCMACSATVAYTPPPPPPPHPAFHTAEFATTAAIRDDYVCLLRAYRLFSLPWSSLPLHSLPLQQNYGHTRI